MTGPWPTLKRTVSEFQEDNLTDWAAALTYYGLLSLFPALIAMVSLIGIFGDPQTTTAEPDRNHHRNRPRIGGRNLQGPDRIDHRKPDRRRLRLRLRPRRRAVVGLRLRRRLHARLERHLRDAGGPAVLEAAAAADRGHAGDDRADGAARRRASSSPARSSDAVADPLGIGGTAVDVWNIAKWPVMAASSSSWSASSTTPRRT